MDNMQTLREENARLRAALEEYGEHGLHCSDSWSESGRCVCGFDEALGKSEQQETTTLVKRRSVQRTSGSRTATKKEAGR